MEHLELVRNPNPSRPRDAPGDIELVVMMGTRMGSRVQLVVFPGKTHFHGIFPRRRVKEGGGPAT